MRTLQLTLIPILLAVSPALAQQHEQHTSAAPADSAPVGMRHDRNGLLGIGMQRAGSGTSWLPAATPMYALHRATGRWELMLHGNVFLQYVDERSDRGGSELGLVNWFMGMASRTMGDTRIGFRAMLSAEPITVGRCGYPDLLATGEFCHGEPLHDRQHPHDLFMELAGHYQQRLGKDLAFEFYGGPVGEPALGPVAYPHRISALPGPLATIGHHWQDATHISFGVATAGFYGRRWKLEGSLFNGREPDEERFDFDLAPLDSYSGRVWLLPNDRWAIQASIGRLIEAEAPREPGGARADVTRATASVTHHQSLGERGIWTSTLVWGQNQAHGLTTSAFLLETNLNLDERNIFFGRGELARKSGEDLVIEDEAPALADQVFTVGKLSLGYVRQFGKRGALLPGIGAQISANFIPAALDRFYGSRMPLGVAVFASVRPRPMRMQPMADAHVMNAKPGMQIQPTHDAHMPAPTAVDTTEHAAHEPIDGMMTDRERMQLMEAIHQRMMSDPVIRERVATDPVLQRLLQGMRHDMNGDTAREHAGHRMDGASTETQTAREVMEFITLLLSDPQIETRMRADPQLHRLWSDPSVQRCLVTMRRLRASGQPLPATCPAAPSGGKQ